MSDEKKSSRSFSLTRAIVAFFLFGGISFLVLYGSYYFGKYGFSISPLINRDAGLWAPLNHYVFIAIAGGASAAGAAYAKKKKNNGKQQE